MCNAKGDVRFTPNSDRKSRHAAKVMAASGGTDSQVDDMACHRDTRIAQPVNRGWISYGVARLAKGG